MKLEINHILIRTTDLDAMIRFFEQVLVLKNGKRPPFAFAGAWLWSDDKPLIHLSETNPVDKGQLDYLGDKKMISGSGTGIIDHVAFTGRDYNKLIERLQSHQMSFFERAVPLTGEHQVFVEGPEGLRVEIQFHAGIEEKIS
jgi:lactoylglutathione lyase